MEKINNNVEIVQSIAQTQPQKMVVNPILSTPVTSVATNTYNIGNDICDKINAKVAAAVVKQKSVFTSNQPKAYNINASPFVFGQFSNSTKNVNNGLHLNNGTRIQNNIPSMSQQSQHIIPKIDSRIWRSISARNITPMYPYDEDVTRIPSMHSLSPYSMQYSARRTNFDFNDSFRNYGPVAMQNGTIQLRLRDGIRVEMTLDQAVRVVNNHSKIAIALSSSTGTAAMVHPNGKVYQYGSRVEVVAYDGMQNNNFVRYAKMWYKGVSFTSENCALIYLVDSAGTRTTSDAFTDMTKDYTISVFLNESRHGAQNYDEALSRVQTSTFWCTDENTEIFDINGFRISQTQDGLVKVTRSNNKCLIRTSPSNGSATLTTPFMHCTASLGQTSHLFVRRGERRMHFDGCQFVVRNAGHSAGFDENNLLKVY